MLLANPMSRISGASNCVWSRMVPTCRRGSIEVRQQHLVKWLMGSFDDADVTSMCDGNDEKSCAWWLADVVSAGHITNQE